TTIASVAVRPSYLVSAVPLTRTP
ncbi:MAG: hypothetical protein JWO22_1547, partial [Frankiales bacterium]|nr:hypothetical protein [Frankiales bacterium]